MLSVVSCSYCSSGHISKVRPVSFTLNLEAHQRHKSCSHPEEEKEWWWLCSPSCVKEFVKNNLNELEEKIVYQEKSLDWQCGNITHEEFLEATKE